MDDLLSLVRRDETMCYTQINDELVVLNPNDENLYHMNATAADLWIWLETPKSIQELAQLLAEKYQGTSVDYQRDVQEWIVDTQQKGLLV